MAILSQLFVNKSGNDAVQAMHNGFAGTWDGIDTLTRDTVNDTRDWTTLGILPGMLLLSATAIDLGEVTLSRQSSLVLSVTATTIVVDPTTAFNRSTGTTPLTAGAHFWKVFVNNGRTAATACLTLQGAVDHKYGIAHQLQVSPTNIEEIVVQSGVYETPPLQGGFQVGQWTADGKVIVDGIGVHSGLTIFGNSILFTGFEIGNYTGNVFDFTGATNTQMFLRDCFIHDCDTVLLIAGGSGIGQFIDAANCVFQNILQDIIFDPRTSGGSFLKLINCVCWNVNRVAKITSKFIGSVGKSTLINNIFANITNAFVNSGSNTTGVIAEGNDFFNVGVIYSNSGTGAGWNLGSNLLTTFAEWQAAGPDKTGLNVSPQFNGQHPITDNLLISDFTLNPKSPLVGAGFFGRSIGAKESANSSSILNSQGVWSVGSVPATTTSSVPGIYSGIGWAQDSTEFSRQTGATTTATSIGAPGPLDILVTDTTGFSSEGVIELDDTFIKELIPYIVLDATHLTVSKLPTVTIAGATITEVGEIVWDHTTPTGANLYSVVYDLGFSQKIGDLVVDLGQTFPGSVWDTSNIDTAPNRNTITVLFSDTPFLQNESLVPTGVTSIEIEPGQPILSVGLPVKARYIQFIFRARDDGVAA